LLLDGDGDACEVDVVIGGEQGDQAENEAADGLSQTEPIKGWPGSC